MDESSRMPRNRRKSPRISAKIQAEVMVQLLGSQTKHEYRTANISTSGMLLTTLSGRKPIFNSQSILEVWLHCDSQEVFCIAKFVRKQDETKFAIKITDIDDRNFELYQQIILNHMPEPKAP